MPDPYSLALEYAEKHPEGFTLGELCQKSGVEKNLCKKLRGEFISSGIFTELGDTRDDMWGTDQHVYTISFNGKSQLLSHRMTDLTSAIVALTVIMLIGLGVQIWFAFEQTNYAKIQSIPERIYQAQQLQTAIAFCEENPESKKSGVFEIATGNPTPCTLILEKYRPSRDELGLLIETFLPALNNSR